MRLGRISGALLGACAVALIVPSVAVAAPIVHVTAKNQMGWTTDDTRPGGAVNFVADPTAPAGKGALQLTTDDTRTAKAQYMHDASVSLSSVSSLSYYTKQNSTLTPVSDPSYQLPVLLGGNGTASFTTLVYEPYQNGVIQPGIWQSWDVSSGLFWSTHSYSAGTCVVTGTPGGPADLTLTAVKTMCPNAVVVGYGVNVGSGNPSYDVETDLFNFNGTVYDFEPKSACSQTGSDNSDGNCSGSGSGPQ